MKKFHSLIFTVLLLLVSFLQISPVFADANSFHFKDLTIDYYLKKTSGNTSGMEVIETFTAEFPNYNQNHGIERVIPFLNQNDTNLTMESASILDIEVTRNGNPEPYTIKTNSNNFIVRIGDVNSYVQNEQTYVLKYKFINVITEFDESGYSTDPYQELYWDSNGTGWAQKFNNVTVNLHMDNDILSSVIKDREISDSTSYKTKSTIHKNNKTANKLAAWCYVGSYGASNQNRCEISDLSDGIQYKAQNLAGGENMTFVLNFNDNTFVVPKNNFVKELTYKNASFDYYLTRDENGKAILKVKENFTATFPTLNDYIMVTRYIPYVNEAKNRFITDNQKDINVIITMDGENVENKTVVTQNDGDFYISFSDNNNNYIHGEHNFTFEYELQDLIEEKTDEEDNKTVQYLHINPLGKKFLKDVDNVSVNIHMDNEILSSITDSRHVDSDDEVYYFKTFCNENTSLDFEHRRCQITENENGYTYTIDNITRVGFMDFIIYFNENTFKISEPNRNFLVWHIFGLFIIIAGIISIITIFKTRRKISDKLKYLKNLPLVPQYTPLKDMTVAEIGTNYLGSVKNIKVATMLELLVDKKITLRKEEKHGIFKNSYNWYVRIIDLNGLTTEQRDFLDILNNGKRIAESNVDKEIKIKHNGYSGALENAFYNYDFHIKKSLESKGLYEKLSLINSITKSKLKQTNVILKILGIFLTTYFGLPLFMFIIFNIASFYVKSTNFTTFAVFEGVWLIPVMVITAMILAIVLPILTTQAEKYKFRTNRSLEVSRYTDGLKLYIKMAEADRLKYLQSIKGADTSKEGIVKLYEKLLPYAALFGLEKSWMQELSHYYELENLETPDWYNIGFSYAVLNSVVRSATHRPIDVSSSSGGSSGGSFSSSSSSGGGGGGW